jgi:hypothetical protein
VEAGYRTLPFPLQELAAPNFRMEANWTLAQLLGYFSTWSATNAFMKATGQNPLEPLAHDLTHVLGNMKTPRTITWPLSLRVGLNTDI